ncbi:DUF3619 family protein [Limnohabitans sp. Rim8]|jgi:hypothetical protein|uniref:DUF3619 family protein n=1 Tax=Limnohabitans sp. Rim8 TaxID=1100718 RepID=UPI0025D66AAA|nr:DUF3619 family protein [Limnohabitans sp. Rim8]
MKYATIQAEDEMDRLGHYFSGQLSLVTTDLPHDISQRLRVARHLALAHRQPALQLGQAQSHQVNRNGSLTASGDEGLNLWNILASSLPLVVLVAGLLAIQWIQDDHMVLEIAATDSALLTDELPPQAYTDAGFAQFLKLNQSSTAQND